MGSVIRLQQYLISKTYYSRMNFKLFLGKNGDLCTEVNSSNFKLHPGTLTKKINKLVPESHLQVQVYTGTELLPRDTTVAQGTTTSCTSVGATKGCHSLQFKSYRTHFQTPLYLSQFH